MSEFENFISRVTQEQWDHLGWKLAPQVHEVDRQATRIWFSFWPLKLTRLLREGDREAVIRDYRLKGNFDLGQQIDSAVSFLYGARYWSTVKSELVAGASSESGGDLADRISASAARVAKAAGVDLSLVHGITAVGYLMAAHLGLDALAKSVSTPARLNRQHKGSPENLCRARSKQAGPGLFGFLKGARRQFRVRTDPHTEAGGYEFKAIRGQDLSMAAKSDTRDYTTIDPRRLEGPIPFECRSGSCGFCWVGVLSPPQRLEPISDYELRRLKYFGYIPQEAPAEIHPPIRLSCQTFCWGDTHLVVSPWNGALNGRS